MSDLKTLGQNKISLKCEICDKEFKNNNGLRRHFNIVHNCVKEHQCNVCQKVFKIHSELSLHLKNVHERKKQHKCDSCGKTFLQAGNLKTHINSVHNGQLDLYKFPTDNLPILQYYSAFFMESNILIHSTSLCSSI